MTLPDPTMTPAPTPTRVRTRAWASFPARLGGVVRPLLTATGAVFGAVVVRWLLDASIGPEAVFLPFGLAVLVAAWAEGRPAGIAASVLSAVIVSVLLIDGTGAGGRLASMVIFLAAGLITTALVSSLRSARRAAEVHAAEAERAHSRLLDERRLNAQSQLASDRALRQSESRFRLLVESVSDYAIFMLDPHGRVMSWNAGAERIKGYAGDEIIGRHFSVFYPAVDQQSGKPASVLKAALRHGRHEDDGWRVRKDGTQFWANVVVSPVRQDDELLGYAKVVRDLTRRHRADVLLESVLDSAIDGIIGVDEHGTIRSFNAAAEHLFGYAATDVIGSPFSALMPEPYRTNGIEYLARHARTGHARILGRGRQLLGLRADGTTFPLELAVSEFTLAGQRYFTGVVRDLTRQHALEEQLHQAQKMQAIGQLAGGVAHDFNNLLTIIAGHTELLLGRYPEPGDLNHALNDIRDAGMRAAGLTRQLLAFSRRAVLEPKVLDLNTVVHDTQRMLRRIVPEDVEMVTRLAPRLHPVSVDQSQIGQVLINLVVNARDAITSSGLIEIETSNCDVRQGSGIHAGARPGRSVMLTVRDNGAGMPPDVMNRVFEPFFTTKQTGAGTGLGLAMVYGIVKQSGGHVEVRSETGAGSEFRVILPAAEHAHVPAPPPPDTDEPLTGDETLLVVEDEESVRRLAVLALREHGYRVIEAGNGAEALRMLGTYNGTIDLVVTDVVMPVMGGRQLVEALRPLRPEARVLYVSGYTDDAVIRHGVQRADVAFLQKPYTPSDLAEKVRRVLDGRD
ncbi:MAG TPA: PAS domain S-box protein [Longimicrobiales bacterium]|nr:PAS domain S-box protein [Longimicrobiales bacterium]